MPAWIVPEKDSGGTCGLRVAHTFGRNKTLKDTERKRILSHCMLRENAGENCEEGESVGVGGATDAPLPLMGRRGGRVNLPDGSGARLFVPCSRTSLTQLRVETFFGIVYRSLDMIFVGFGFIRRDLLLQMLELRPLRLNLREQLRRKPRTLR